ncbi:hypothetical protein Pmani_019448 [Petrolisthes manimaculis]|uniref:C-type lectin domain-containing protein n=1 Tax=Petrolisthes manimaculis TaxID=1843537 RepID=A0AAE1PIF1_9EUCA|nr:hypothetical protein Pmani_019448 [Petrolisthes manimaculis]
MNNLLSLGLLMVLGATSEASTTQPSIQEACPIPYVTVGGHCLFFDALEEGTWQHSRNFCEQLQGHLVKIETDNFMADVFYHIHHHGLADASFWIGANDLAQEGVWKWHDGSDVRMGTPFWAYVADRPPKQEPQGGTKENCVCLNKYYLYFFHDYECGLEFSPICEYSANKSISRDFIVNGLSDKEEEKVEEDKEKEGEDEDKKQKEDEDKEKEEENQKKDGEEVNKEEEKEEVNNFLPTSLTSQCPPPSPTWVKEGKDEDGKTNAVLVSTSNTTTSAGTAGTMSAAPTAGTTSFTDN